MKQIVYVVVAVVAAAAGFGIYRYAIEPRVAPSATGPTVGHVAQAIDKPSPGAEAPAESPPPIPDVLPDFTLADLDGKPTSIRSWPGKSMIVNFWATWCAPCRREIPLLKTIQQRHGAEGFQVVGVAVDFREDVVKFAKEIGMDYPVLIGEQDGLEAVNKFGQGSIGFPFTVFTDRQQRIVLFHLGEIDQAKADVLLGVVEKVNRGELTPEAARVVAAKQLQELPPSEA
jgi:thiol-disulfide isomerase/thioredoxin